MINPLVSVLMTAYNRQQFISEAIESVLAATYQNWELIIVDDQSRDNTVSIAKSYQPKDQRIKIYVNESNLGDYSNRNRAASYAKGEFIIYVDSDDKLFSDSLDRLLPLMLSSPNVHFGMYSPYLSDTVVFESSIALRRHFFEQQFLYIGPGGTIIRRSFFKKIGGYPEKYGPANDMYFNLKACCYTSIVMIPFEFVYYRRHEGQEINNTFNYLYNNYRYLNAALDELPLPLSRKEVIWLHKKNKRRFVVNVFKYFSKTRNLSGTRIAIKKAKFGFSDFLQGIFH